MSGKKNSAVFDNDILTEAQKNELLKIIDELVEERVREKNKAFVNKYTDFIVESATAKISEKVKDGFAKKVKTTLKEMDEKYQKVCRSVILEATHKIGTSKKKMQKLVEEFKQTAPKIIEKEVDQKTKQLSEDAVAAIQKYEEQKVIVEGLLKGLNKIGYVINEDVDGAVKKKEAVAYTYKTRAIKAERDLKIRDMCEGLLPDQKEQLMPLLEECETAEVVEKKFKSLKNKVLNESTNSVKVEPKQDTVKEIKEVKTFQEEEMFKELLTGALKFNKKF